MQTYTFGLNYIECYRRESHICITMFDLDHLDQDQDDFHFGL